MSNVTSSYPSLLRILQTGLLQSIRATRTCSISVRMTSAARKRNPDLNWHTQYEKLLFHVTRSTDTDQTSGLVNSVAQKNNRGQILFSLSPSYHSWCHQAGSKVSAAPPGITYNCNIQRKKRDRLFLRLYLCCEETFSYRFPSRLPPGFISRTDLILKQDMGRRTCHFIKPFPDQPFKITTAPQHHLPTSPSGPAEALFSSLVFITMCFALLFVHFLFTHTITSTSLCQGSGTSLLT